MLTNEQKKIFGEQFTERYLAHGFGSMTKSEIDTLVFHLLAESNKIKNKSNYEVSNILKITEAKVKSLKLNASLKYKQANHKGVLGDIVLRIIDVMNKPDFTNGVVIITIENPVEKRELEYAIKKTGRNIEYGINRELLKISPLSLFEVILDNLENPESQFRTIIQNTISDQSKKDNILSSALTFRQKLNKVGEELTEKSGLISILQAGVMALAV